MTRWRMTMIEPTLDDLLDDEIMRPVMRSAGIDADRLKEALAETARRLAGVGLQQSLHCGVGARC